MKRPSYKMMYLKEQSNKESYKECLDKLLETLKTFDNVKVIDKIHEAYPLDKLREIEVRQNNKYLQIMLNIDVLESQGVDYD